MSRPGFDQTRGAKKMRDSSSGDAEYSPEQLSRPDLIESLQEYDRPENMFSLIRNQYQGLGRWTTRPQTANGIM